MNLEHVQRFWGKKSLDAFEQQKKKDKGSQSNYAEDKVGCDEKDVFVFSVFKINKSTSCLLMELSNRISVEREFMAERAIFWGTS